MNKLWGTSLAAVFVLLAACGSPTTRNEPPPPARLTLDVTAINWDARNNNQFQTYFSVDVRLRASPPFRDGVTLEPGRFSYALKGGDITYSSYPYLQTSSCTPPVLLYSSTCRINFMFRDGLSRDELAPATLSYTFVVSGSVDIIQLP